MTLVGGKRDRMILESMLRQIEAYLATLGWFDLNRQHRPITVVDVYPGDDGDAVDEVAINTMAFSYGDSFQEQYQMGNNAETHIVPIYIDFYGEADALTRHVLGDIYYFLGLNPVLPIYDYDLATPVEDFRAEIVPESVTKTYPSRATNPWQKHWGIVSFLLEDERENV